MGTLSPIRNEQFESINNKVKQLADAGDPVVSVDTKKKENIGQFKNNGQEYRKKKDPHKVLSKDAKSAFATMCSFSILCSP